MGSFSSLNIGFTALSTSKLSLDTAGQNIANAATPGYARQRVTTEANRPQINAYGAVGTGVGVKKITHITDSFLEMQVRSANSDMGSIDVYQDGYENLEVYFNELSQNSLSGAFERFWDSLQDWNNNVDDISTRRNVASEAQTLCDAFKSVRTKITDYRYQQNLAVKDTVENINEFTSQISQLNASILRAESGGVTGVTASDLRDQRTEALKELSNILDVTVTEESNGSVTVAQKGRMLVYQDQQFLLGTERINSNGMLIDNVVFARDGEEVKTNAGKLYGMTQVRDDVMVGYLDDLDQVAGEFLWNFNRLHSQGNGLSAYQSLVAQNEVLDPNATLDQLQYNFTPVENTYEIVDGSFEIRVYDEGSGQENIVNIDIDLSNVDDEKKTILGSSEMTEVSPGVWQVVQPENSLVRKIQDALDSVSAGTFSVSLDYGNQLRIESNSEELQFAFGRDTSGALAALGLNTFFSGYNADTISVQEEYNSHPEYLAGSAEFIAGDQTNALKLLALRTDTVMSSGTASVEDFYQGIIGRLGIEASRVDALYTTQKDILVQVENQREDLSGVNLDEEMTKMLQYQTSYQAAAKFITTVNVLLDTLIQM